jgi:RNA polymerase primary sigma factor
MALRSRFFELLFSSSARRMRFLHADGVLKDYVQDLHMIPLLTPEEETALLARAASAEKEARQEARQRLVEANLRLVVLIAVYFQGRGLPLAELVQEGNLGLLEAIARFDPHKARRLSTYAKFWIVKYIRQALQQQRRLIQTPARAAGQIEQIERVLGTFRARGIEPTPQELARESHLPVEKVIALLEVIPDPLSLQRHQQDEDPLAEILEAPAFLLSNGPGGVPALTTRVSQALGQLSPSEQQVLMLRFGLLDGVEYDDYHEVAHLVFNRRGKRVDERVRQIEKSAMNKLRVLLEASEEG